MKRLLIAFAGFLALFTAVASAEQLPHSMYTIKSAIAVEPSAHTATLPLHRAVSNGTTIWYIITDSSNAADAKKLGVNYAPSLGVFAPTGARTPRGIWRRMTVAPDFRPSRSYVASATGFPPKSATPGAIAPQAYSPFDIFGPIVRNAPVVATGNGPFDVIKHTNTEDRVVAMDTKKMTVTLVMARGFFNGKPVYYISTEASNPIAASVERATYAPSLAKASSSAEIPIGVVADGPQTGSAPQGLAFLTLRTPLAVDATAKNASTIVSSFNVLSLAPDLTHPYAENGYTPLWNVMVVGAKQTKRLTSYSQIAPLAKAAGFVVNCPVVAYGDDSGY